MPGKGASTPHGTDRMVVVPVVVVLVAVVEPLDFGVVIVVLRQPQATNGSEQQAHRWRSFNRMADFSTKRSRSQTSALVCPALWRGYRRHPR